MVKVRFEIAAANLVATGLAILVMSGAAIAQEKEQAADAPLAIAVEPDAEQPAPANPDEMADDLNSSQQLKQTFTLRRTVDGEVVETEKRTVTYDRDTPYRETEAGKTTVERLKAAFDGEALTRTEAFEEAKLDFIVADVNRDDKLTSEEFAGLVDSWRKNETRQAGAPTQDIARQRQYDAFLEEIDPAAAEQQGEAYAKQKFAFIAGAAATISLQDYIREYLLDFDAMDADKDMVLSSDELMRFRALNRGETLEM
jgi:hypothetical protein